MPEPESFSPVATARALLRRARTAALATLARRTGHPFASMVSIACEPDGAPLLLMSTLAAHSRNLADDPRASLLIEDRSVADPQQGARVTVVGRIETLAEPAAAARRYLARYPEAALYAGFGDFAFFRLDVEDAHLVAGFGRAMRVRRDDLLLDLTGRDALLAAEPDILAAFDADPARVARLAARLGAPAGDWRVIGIDPEGLDLATRDPEARRFRRLVLPALATSAETLANLLDDWENTSGMQDLSQID